MNTCNYCQKEKKSHTHCKRISEELEKLDSGRIRYLYESGYSAHHIAEELGIKKTQIYRILDNLSIPRRSLRDSANQKSRKEKIESTNLKKYGFKHNFSKNHKSRIEWENRLLNEEGITNVGQREEVKNKIKNSIQNRYGTHYMNLPEVQEKWRETCMEKYGSCHPMKNPDIKEKLFNILYERYGGWWNNSQFSKLHKDICKILDDNNISHTIELKLRDNDRLYFYDILISGSNKIIEVNGDYWHANPSIYKKDDIINYPRGNFYAKDIWKSDEIKLDSARNKGYQFLILWEKDIRNDVTNTIYKILNYARG